MIPLLSSKQECNTSLKVTLLDETQSKQKTEAEEDDTQIDEKALRQFLRGGHLTVRHVRCIIVGCGNAGKTTLLKRLQNVSFEELIKADKTEMVDVHAYSFEVLAEEHTIQSKPFPSISILNSLLEI